MLLSLGSSDTKPNKDIIMLLFIGFFLSCSAVSKHTREDPGKETRRSGQLDIVGHSFCSCSITARETGRTRNLQGIERRQRERERESGLSYSLN